MVIPVNLRFFSFESIEQLRKYIKLVGFLTGIYADEYGAKQNLAAHIAYFAISKTAAVKSALEDLITLKRQYPDPIQKLGCAYASIFTLFMGNFTTKIYGSSADQENEYFWAYLETDILIEKTKI